MQASLLASKAAGSTPAVAGAASLAPRRRRRLGRSISIQPFFHHVGRRALTPPSHASTSYSQEQKHQHGLGERTEAELAAEEVAKAVRKGRFIFLLTFFVCSFG
jgi:hypothetical protein